MVLPETRHICNKQVIELQERNQAIYGTKNLVNPNKSLCRYKGTDSAMDRYLDRIDNATPLELKPSLNGFVQAVLFDSLRENNYFVKLNCEKLRMLCNELDIDLHVFSALLNAAISNGLFDKDMYEKHTVLTSGVMKESYSHRFKESAFDLLNI